MGSHHTNWQTVSTTYGSDPKAAGANHTACCCGGVGDVVGGWNDSYGNQVLLDNGAGLSTRYSHMMQTAVTAGEAVTAGQVCA